ncbi:hypothetical protein [Haloferula sp. A504]|uniref:hypothetical protein n=1 Tax=Haloferula sp. A504 TaxID=3373601 RepID=UPI0031BBE6F6|nr:hypothetical protein [Verrucomicrobiaceae bacterium E54]
MFLVWLWLGFSKRYWGLGYTSIEAPAVAKISTIESFGGALSISQFEYGFGLSGPVSYGWEWLVEDIEDDDLSGYFSVRPAGFASDSNGWSAWLDWWVMIVLYAGGWAVSLFLWQRRKNRRRLGETSMDHTNLST